MKDYNFTVYVHPPPPVLDPTRYGEGEGERKGDGRAGERGREGDKGEKSGRDGGEERRGEERRGGMTYMWNYRRQVKKFAKALKERLATEREIKYLDIFDDMLATDKDDLYAPYKFDGMPSPPSYSYSFSLPLSPPLLLLPPSSSLFHLCSLSLPIFMN